MSWSAMLQLIQRHEHRPQVWLEYWNTSNSRSEFTADLDMAICNSDMEDFHQTRDYMIRLYQELIPSYNMMMSSGMSASQDPRVSDLGDKLEFLSLLIQFFSSYS